MLELASKQLYLEVSPVWIVYGAHLRFAWCQSAHPQFMNARNAIVGQRPPCASVQHRPIL